MRGLQEVEVRLPLATDVFAFRHLLAYVGCTLTLGLATIGLQRRQAAVIRRVNGELERANGFLAEVSGKLARYLPPQLFDAIFKGAKDATVATERKKLTVFFADIAEFTEAAERLQPEELTALLNEYLTEMSRIAVAHGATVDKFVGDAIVGFFGDPETRGSAEDAKACLEMALAMRARARGAGGGVGAARRRAAVPNPDRDQHGLLQCRQLRQRGPARLHDRRGGGEPRGAAAGAGGAGRDRARPRDLGAGARPGLRRGRCRRWW